jgi:thioredoxin 1
MAVLEVNETNFKSEVLDYNGKVLVDFNAEWCGPCKMLAPVLEEIAEANNTVKFVSVNVDVNERIAADYNIMSIPCLVMIENGKEVKRSVGLVPKVELERFIGE